MDNNNWPEKKPLRKFLPVGEFPLTIKNNSNIQNACTIFPEYLHLYPREVRNRILYFTTKYSNWHVQDSKRCINPFMSYPIFTYKKDRGHLMGFILYLNPLDFYNDNYSFVFINPSHIQSHSLNNISNVKSLIKEFGYTFELIAHLRDRQKNENIHKHYIGRKKVEEYILPEFEKYYGKENIGKVDIKGSYVDIYVKYGDTVIKNSRGSSHTIKDLYLCFSFRFFDGHESISGSDLRGARFTVTEHESGCNYAHSHLSRGVGNFSRFCLGSSPVGRLLGTIQYLNPVKYFNLPASSSKSQELANYFEALFIHTDHLIQYQDNSNPYKFFEHLPTSMVPIDPNIVRDCLSSNAIYFLLDHVTVKISNSDKDIPYVVVELDDEIDDFLEQNPDAAVVCIGGKYYDYLEYKDALNVTGTGMALVSTEKTDFSFNNRWNLNKKVIKNPLGIDLPKDLPKEIAPGILLYLSEILNYQIFNYIKNDKTKKQSSNSTKQEQHFPEDYPITY